MGFLVTAGERHSPYGEGGEMMKRILWLAMAAILLFGCATMYTQHEEIILP